MKTSKENRKTDSGKKKPLYTKKVLGNLRNNVTLDLLEAIDTPRALALAIAYRGAAYKNVPADLLQEDHPIQHDSAYSFWKHRQAIALFKKSEYLDYEGDAELESLQSFFEVDQNCQNSDNLILNADFKLRSILQKASEYIQYVLGETPNMDSIYKKLVFTTGSVSGLSGKDVNLVTKLQELTALPVSRGALPLVSYLTRDPLISNVYINSVPVDYATLFTVKKQFNKVRVAAKSQLGNMLLQRPIGVHIANRLKKVGIDLAVQPKFHAFLVEKFWDVYATVDQSDASDRICVELVRTLLPYDWFRLLDLTRHRHLKFEDGSTQKMLKFANQGNGFIFELQTLIYYALAKATVWYEHGVKAAEETLISVFGDDLICEEQYAPAVVKTLESVGQKINLSKSYLTGRFKESCGVDTFDGFSIRPLYLKKHSRGLRGIYEIHNLVVSISWRSVDNLCFNSTYSRALLRVRNTIEIHKHRSYGSPKFGDSVLWSSDQRTGYYKGGVWYQKQLTNTHFTKRSKEWTDEYVQLPRALILSDQEISRRDIFVATVYALLGGDSRGSVSKDAPPRYSFLLSAALSEQTNTYSFIK